MAYTNQQIRDDITKFEKFSFPIDPKYKYFTRKYSDVYLTPTDGEQRFEEFAKRVRDFINTYSVRAV